MRILAIRGENLASLEGAFEVDLVGGVLGRSGLFAITGPTGAGKSTLLDALCLALYDKIPRLADAKKVFIGQGEEKDGGENAKDVKSIMRRGTAHCRAEVEFIGVDGVHYQARWEARRANRKITGRWQDQSVTLLNLDTEQALGGTKTETLDVIKERVGLSFEQFRRSVLLAQGDFAAFLKADANERAELLERMTGTEIYSQISIAAFDRMRDEKKALAELGDERGRLETLDDDARSGLDKERTGLQVRLAEEKSAQKRARTAVSWYEDLFRYEGEVKKGTEAEAKATRDWEAAGPRRKELEKVLAAEPFRSTADALDRTEEQLARSKGERDQARKQEAHAQSRRDAAQQTEARVSGRIVQLAAQAEEHAHQAEQWLVAHSNLGPLERIWDRCSQDITSLAQGEAALGVELEKVGKLVPELVGKRGDDLMLGLTGALTKGKVQLKAAEDAMSLDDRRGELVEGEPCPLCGSQEHPWAEHSPLSNLAGERKAFVRALEQIERSIVTRWPVVEQARARLVEDLAEVEDWESRLKQDAKLLVKQLGADVTQYRVEDETKKLTEEMLVRVEAVLPAEQRASFPAAAVPVEGDGDGADMGTLITALTKARSEEQGAREQVQAATTAARLTDDQVRGLEKERSDQVADLSTRAEEAGISREEIRERLARGEEWIQFETRALAKVEQQHKKAKNILEERKRQRDDHLAGGRPELSEKEARDDLTRLEEITGGTQKRIIEIEVALKIDAKTRRAVERLDGKMDEQGQRTELWQQLGQVIGSRDGDKFRRFAQSLTLDALVVQANVHLRDLARRYRVQRVPKTAMDIQMVDREMGDEFRSVNSLSGGETFLVSLAMALGLASLSARQMSVESLFIDEGFGSLDMETLEIALSALESLQATGRQVGVISHVQGLAATIGAQVTVEKIGAGKSRVVVGEIL